MSVDGFYSLGVCYLL